MRILLVKPDSELATIRRLDKFLLLEPLELELLAGAVSADHEIEILDLGTKWFATRAFVRAIRRLRPDVIGLTAYTHQSRRALALAQLAKGVRPEARIVVGGHHATLVPQDFNQPCIDFVVRGEGCGPFRAIVEALARGMGDVADGAEGTKGTEATEGIEGTDGPTSQPVSASPRRSSPRPATPRLMIPGALQPGDDFARRAAEPIPPIPPLNSLPRPRRELVDRSKYFSVWSKEDFSARRGDTLFPRVASMRTSLGCAFRCKFCVVPYVTGGRYLQLTPEETVEAFASVAERHIYLVDDETFLNVPRMTRVAELIKARGLDKKFVGWARSLTVVEHPELFRLWREAGLEIVYIGFEAAVDTYLKEYDKRSTVDTNERAHRLLREMGVTTHAAFMARSDWTHGDFDLLEEYVRRMPPAEITFTIYTPSPGTPNWEEERGDFAADPIKLHDCMHALFPTRMPLKEFYARFARLSRVAEYRNPLRVNRCLISPLEIARIVWAGVRYRRALARAWRDHE